MKVFRYILAISILFGSFVTVEQAVAQPLYVTDSLEFEVCFRRGYSIYERDFQNNGKRMDEFVQSVEAYMQDSLCQIKSINIVGAASPEGLLKFNRTLAAKRAATVKACLSERLGKLTPLMKTKSIGVDWKGLEQYIREHDLPHREQILNIITKTPEVTYSYDGNPRESRKLRLMYLNNGADWKYLLDNVFPNLRSGTACVSMIIEKPAPPQVIEPEPVVEEPVVEQTEEKVEEPQIDTIPQPTLSEEPTVAPKKAYTPWLAIKTNMLYDVALVPTLGVEACLGNRVSLAASWSYSWWRSDKVHWYWQTYGGDVAVRYWLGKRSVERRLTGHHLGVYAQMNTFDYEAGNYGIQAPNWVFSAGVEYGFSLPIGRRLNIDFTVGAGYIHGEFMEYKPIDTHYVWQATKRVPPFCITKAEVSLVWLIGRNRDSGAKRGGAR